MKKGTVLGLFSYVDDCVTAIEELKKAGCDDFEVFSPIPSHDIEHLMEEEKKLTFNPKELFGRMFIKRDFQVARFTLIGAIFGVILAWTVAGATAVWWPIQTGGMPIVSLPPIALVTYELMSLGAAIFSVFGFFYLGRLFRRNLGTYSPAVSNNKFSVVVYDASQKTLNEAKEILEKCGCEKIETGPEPKEEA